MLESLWNGALLLAAARLYKEPQWQIQSDQLRASSERERESGSQAPGRAVTRGTFLSYAAASFWYFF